MFLFKLWIGADLPEVREIALESDNKARHRNAYLTSCMYQELPAKLEPALAVYSLTLDFA